MKIAQPIINEIMPESSALLIFRGAHKSNGIRVAMRQGKPRAVFDPDNGRLQGLVETAKPKILVKVFTAG